MVIRVTAQGTTRVKRVVAAGTTIVKSITVGLPQIQGQASVGVLTGLDDVNNGNRQNGYILLYDSDAAKFIYVDPKDEARSAVDAADLGGDGEFTYDSATGIFSYRGPTDAEVRAHLSDSGSITYNASTGKIYYSFDSDIQTIGTHVLPKQTETYDLGSESYRFRDLWLKGTTIHLGNITLNDSNGTLTPKDSSGAVASINLTGSNTDNLPEGNTNLYYTNQRARASLTVNTDATNLVQYDSVTGVFTFRDSDYARSDIQDTFREGLILPSDKKIEFKEDLGGEIIADFFENQGNMFIRRTNNDALADPYVEVGYVEPDYTERLPITTGNIFIMTRDAGFLYVKSFDGDRDIAHFHDQGPVDLYYNNVKRISTTDSGGLFTGNLQVTENATIYGNLRVDGVTTTINSTTLSVNDKNIVLADSAVDSSASNGAGITVGGSGASIIYNHLNGSWDLNRPLGNNINAISNFTTSNLSEGSNLYYTTARHNTDFDNRFPTEFDNRLANKTTDDLTEGTNLYYTQARFDSAFGLKTTNNLAEGDSNLYYTTDRVNTDIDNRVTTSFVNNLNVDASTLNSLSSSQFLRSDAQDTKTQGDLFFNQGVYARFGNDSNFTIGKGAGLPFINSTEKISVLSDGISFSNTGGGGTKININSGDGGVQLYSGGTEILSTNDSGVNVTGNLEVSGSFVTVTTDGLSQGTTNLYYSSTLADSDFDVRLATKSTSDLSEGSNLYYTTARADSDARHAISGSQDISYDPTTGVISIDVEQVYSFANFDSDFRQRLLTTTTDSIGEGNNLYYTTARADSDARYAIQVVDNGGDGSLTYHTPTGVITYTGPSAAEVRAHFASSGDITYDESSGTFSVDVSQIYTAAEFDSDLGQTSTDALPEGSTNLYYTTARADSDAKHALTAGTSIVYDDSSGTISTVQGIDSTDNVAFNQITNRDGITIATPPYVDAGSGTVKIDQFAHNNKFLSFEYLIHLSDSSTGPVPNAQVTKMLGTFVPGTGVVSNEFGTVFQSTNYMGELDIIESGGNICLEYTKASHVDPSVRAKVHKTILR